MRRLVYYGYDVRGKFYVKTLESDPGFATESQSISELSRAECQKISKHMQFGKKGEERVMEFVNGKEIK